MADFNNAIMTNDGVALLAASTAGTVRLKFTKLVTGSGIYTDQEKTRESLQIRTSLKMQKQEFPFSSITMDSETCIKLVALVSNATLDEGYYVNEVGIYAVDELDPNAEPVLYSIAMANVADYLPPYNGLTPSTITQEYFTTVDNALEVTIQAKTGAVALAEDLEGLIKDFNKMAEQNEKWFNIVDEAIKELENLKTNFDEKVEEDENWYTEVDDDIKRIMQDNDHIYPGRDLTIVFAQEIAQYSNAWTWIKERIKAHNFTGIHVADYIPITMNGQIMKMQIAGIDTYYRTGTFGRTLNHHIDFISKDCFDQMVTWNNKSPADNNGTAAENAPYMASDLRKFLITTLYNYLPVEVKSVICNKRTIMEHRYGTSSLRDSTSWDWEDIGALWVPTEYEVFGSCIWGTKPWSQGQTVQYPIFANSYLHRIKCNKEGGNSCNWWLATATGGASGKCIYVQYTGNSYGNHNASSNLYVPVCFRIDDK